MPAAVASSDPYHEDSASPLTATKPTGTVSGDLLVFAIVQGGSTLSALTAPTGWAATSSAGAGSCTGKVWTKAAGGSEPSTYDFPYEAGADVAAMMHRVTGADTTPTLVQASTGNGPSTGSVDSPSVTPNGADDLLMVFMGVACGGSTLVETDPSGTTDAGQAQEGSFQAIAAAYQQLASGSATGAKTWTSITPASKPGVTFTLAIKSAAGGATPIALADAGSEAEAVTVAAAVPLADAGSAAQSIAVTSATPLADAGSEAEAVTVAAAVPLADTGSEAEALTVAAAVPLADTGSAAQSIAITATAPLAEGGQSSEALSIVVTLSLSDAASAADAATGTNVGTTISLADGGSAAEALTVVATLGLSDAGRAADAIVAAAPSTGLVGNAHGRLPVAAGSVIVHTGTIAGAVS